MTARRRARSSAAVREAVGELVIPDELRYCPKTGPVSEWRAWQDRRKAFAREHGLVDERGRIDWHRWSTLLSQQRNSPRT